MPGVGQAELVPAGAAGGKVLRPEKPNVRLEHHIQAPLACPPRSALFPVHKFAPEM